MVRALTAVDLGNTEEIIEKKQAKRFAALATQLGIDISLDALRGYVDPIVNDGKVPSHDWAPRTCETVLQVIYRALRAPEHYALDHHLNLCTVLVVRRDMELVVGVQLAPKTKPFPKAGWKVKAWSFKEPAKNQAAAQAWAKDRARAADALRVPITALPDAEAADDRGDTLLAAVCADPEDAAARMVYADWLVEQGDMRGELIRVQCELESAALAARERTKLAARAEELERSYGNAIAADVAPFVERAELRRGLVERIEITAKNLAAHGAAIALRHPITAVRVLVASRKDVARLAKLPLLAQIPVIELEGRRNPRKINCPVPFAPTAIADAEMFANTRELELADATDAADEWLTFLRELQAPTLRRLSLANVDLPARGIELLADPAILPGLRGISLRHPSCGASGAPADAVIEAFEALAKRPRLETFRFSVWLFGDAPLAKAVAALLASKSLVRLEISNSNMNRGDTLAAIQRHGARLETLVLTDPRGYGLREVTELVASKTLNKLTRLELEAGGTAADVEAMVKALVAAPTTLKQVVWKAVRTTEMPLTTKQRDRIAATRYLELR